MKEPIKPTQDDIYLKVRMRISGEHSWIVDWLFENDVNAQYGYCYSGFMGVYFELTSIKLIKQFIWKHKHINSSKIIYISIWLWSYLLDGIRSSLVCLLDGIKEQEVIIVKYQDALDRWKSDVLTYRKYLETESTASFYSTILTRPDNLNYLSVEDQLKVRNILTKYIEALKDRGKLYNKDYSYFSVLRRNYQEVVEVDISLLVSSGLTQEECYNLNQLGCFCENGKISFMREKTFKYWSEVYTRYRNIIWSSCPDRHKNNVQKCNDAIKQMKNYPDEYREFIERL